MTPATTTRSFLQTLRSLMPARPLSFQEALQRAELQACRLLELAGTEDGPIPETVISDQPRVVIEDNYLLGSSGSSEWRDSAWRIQLNALEPEVRRRFTLAHEFKHVLDAPFDELVYARLRSTGDHHPQIEQICDYFAACLLMPKRLVKRAWGEGQNDVLGLAQTFVVSPQAMHIRLQTLGLIERPARCHTPRRLVAQQAFRRPSPRRYLRLSTIRAGAMR